MHKKMLEQLGELINSDAHALRWLIAYETDSCNQIDYRTLVTISRLGKDILINLFY